MRSEETPVKTARNWSFHFSCQLYLACIFIAGKGEFYLGSTSCLIRGFLVLVAFI